MTCLLSSVVHVLSSKLLREAVQHWGCIISRHRQALVHPRRPAIQRALNALKASFFSPKINNSITPGALTSSSSMLPSAPQVNRSDGKPGRLAHPHTSSPNSRKVDNNYI